MVQTRGESRTERVLSLVLLGDLVSIYLAVLRGVDPTPVAVIEDFKARLASLPEVPAPMTGLLSIDLDGAVALVTLQRPEKRNALSIDLRLELADAFGRLADDAASPASCSPGPARAFCAGMDVTQFGGDRAHKQRLGRLEPRRASDGRPLPKPLVAAVNGPAIAGRLRAGPAVRPARGRRDRALRLPGAGRQIPPSYAAALGGLPEPVARELCLTGRVMEAPEALHHALVVEVVPDTALVERSLAVASGIAKQPLETLLEVKAPHPARGRPRPRPPVRRRGARPPRRLLGDARARRGGLSTGFPGTPLAAPPPSCASIIFTSFD